MDRIPLNEGSFRRIIHDFFIFFGQAVFFGPVFFLNGALKQPARRARGPHRPEKEKKYRGKAVKIPLNEG